MKPDPKKTIDAFTHIYNEWETALPKYPIQQLKYKPSDQEWSLGQVYSHILDAGLGYMLPKIDKCLAEQKNKDKEINENGKMVFENDSFPNQDIRIPGLSDYQPENPDSVESIEKKLIALKEKMNQMSLTLAEKPESGKSAHRAFDYLDAYQWFRLIPLHMKHHFRQKQKLDGILFKK